jgi:acetoin utilization protein AcuB
MISLFPNGRKMTIQCKWTAEDRVSSLMTLASSLVLVQATTTRLRAIEIANASRIHHLLVVDDGRLTGVVCICDLRGETGDDDLVANRTNYCPWVIEEDASLAEAAALMAQQKIGCLPVVRDRELRGIITRSDFRQVGVDLLEIAA